MKNKTCKNKRCKNINPQVISNFIVDMRTKDRFFPICKDCKRDYDKDRYWANKEKILANSKRYFENNHEKVTRRHQDWRDNNKEYISAYLKEYNKKNPGVSNAKTRKYQADKKKALPHWITKEQLIEIKLIYRNCPEGFEVDHIIPLRGKGVCGLHVPWNLQYLTVKENRVKGTKY